ncbi:MAG: transcriptional repressor [Parvularculaceae bacterium]|nr:transcriptional repressor [Parvularculaceae bacterium]
MRTDAGGSSPNLAAAIAKCRLSGAQITPLREAVLKALWSTEQPLGAYELRDQVSQDVEREISAPTIYRTLDFLCAHGVAVRIESRNAYVACKHPHDDHACILFVCNECGASSEVENKKLERLLAADAKALGFSIDHRVLELSGSCAACAG